MPYLGSTPNASFSSRTKQDFTANGSTTAFTLSSAVASPNDIEVFVGNVRQEPTDAYTVNGTTLTMSEAPATGLNFYVVFKGLEENSVIPADNTISTAKIASGAVTDAKIAGMATSKLTGALPVARFPSGTIIQTQVHQETGLTYFTHPSSAGDDRLLLATNANDSTSHLSVNITPNFSTSKILISVRLFFEGNNTSNHEYLFDIYRDSTKLGQPRVGNRRGGISATNISYSQAQDINSTPETQSFNFYDSPSTTSQITYAAAFNHSSNSGQLHMNKAHLDNDSIAYERGTSIIIAQEIAQ